MFWRGGISPAGYFNRDGWHGRGPVLGQAPDTDCTGDVCVVIASRLDAAKAKTAYEKIKYAFEGKPECILQAGSQELGDKVATKLESVVLGISSSAALTKAEAEYLSKLEACIGTAPAGGAAPAPAASTPAGAAATSGESAFPTKTLLIGGGVLAAIALIVAVAK